MSLQLKSILLVDGVDVSCTDLLKKYNVDVTTRTKISKEELLLEIPKYDALVVRSATKVTREIIDAGTSLQLIARAGAGFDNIDVEYAATKGVAVIIAPGANAISACELTCGLMMALARHIVPAAACFKVGRWERDKYTGTELYGKVLAVLGLGRVGKEVATRMRAFGMTVVGYDPYLPEDDGSLATRMKLEEIWPIADYISLHMPLYEDTKDFINASVLNLCKKGVKIINVGRGGLLNEQDLLNALENGQVGGAALDVFKKEPPTDQITRKIIEHPAVLATPHLGASSLEAQVRVGDEIAHQIINLIKPGTYLCVPFAEVTHCLHKRLEASKSE